METAWPESSPPATEAVRRWGGQLPRRTPPHPSPGLGLTFSGLVFSRAAPTLPARGCLVLSILAARGNGIFSLGLDKQSLGQSRALCGELPAPATPPPAKGRGGASPSWGAAGTDRSPQRARGSVREGPACSPREGGTRCPAAPTKGRLLEARRAAVPGSLRPREGCKRSPSLTPGGGNGLGGTSAPPGSPRERGLHPCPPPGRALW